MGDSSSATSRTYDSIWLANPVPLSVGRFKLIDRGLGWQDRLDSSNKFTINILDVKTMTWSRCAKDYSLKLSLTDGSTKRFDGFHADNFKDLSTFVSQNYNMKLNIKEMSVRGWNWGAMDITPSNLSFSIGGKSVFEIPVEEITSINGQNKDVNIDIKERSQITPSIPGQKRKPRDDVLVQMQLFVPGMEGDDVEIDDEDLDEESKNVKNEKKEQGEKEDGEIEDIDNEEGKVTAAASFASRLKRAANLGTNAGEELSKFQKIMCLTPRGRFDLIIYPTHMRMVGTSHDITIQFKNIKSLFLLPRPDLIYHTLVVSLQPPLRQGNTKYPFLVFHFEEAEHSLTIEEKLINEKCPGKLQVAYDGLLHEVFSDVLSGLTEKEILLPSEKYRSDHEKNTGIKCSYKAAEAFLYPLDSGFISIPKPTMFFKHNEINKVTFSRIGGQTTRTMEIKIDVSGIEY
ncbi:FACT complex subunit, partial [Nowakowskiella sp. JEL0078]